jgi:hypothetical protein
MFGAHGVAAPDYLLVRRPGIAGLGPDLLFNPGEPRFVYAAQSCGLVLDAEQDEASVFRFSTHPSLLR